MSARRTHDSSEFRLEALEGRSLLSGIPAPDAASVTLLNGQHPVANETFLNPEDDWTVAQGGHDSGLPPLLNDDDMYAFEDEDLAWADQWDNQSVNDEYDQYDDFDPNDYAGVTGLPAAATQHGGPAHVPPAQLIDVDGLDADGIVDHFDATPAPDAIPSDFEEGAPEVTLLRPLEAASGPSFLDFSADPGALDSDAALFTFGTSAKSAFLSIETRKPGLVTSFLADQAGDFKI